MKYSLLKLFKYMKTKIDYIYILKGVIIVLIFNVIPFSIITFETIILKSLKNENINLQNEIDKEIEKNNLNEMEYELDSLNYQIEKYIDNEKNYKSFINNLDNEIENLKLQINKLSNQKILLNTKVEDLKDYNMILNKEYNNLKAYIISNVDAINQYPNYPNGCEGIALAILLKYYNVNPSLEEIMDALPKGSVPYYKNGILYGGNPNYEFLGDPRSIDGWGIWDKGLAITANKFKNGIINGTELEFNEIIKLLRKNRPVIVWTSIDLIKPFDSYSWIYEPTNEKITWKSYNHAVVVIGYTENTIIISDPITGTIRNMNRKNFINVYNSMGKKAIYY